MKRLFVISLLCLLSVGISRAEVPFSKITLADALKQASTEHRGIMIDFFTEWCYWCKVMDAKTFSDLSVGNFAKEKFVALKVDAEKGEGVSLAQRYSIHGYPSVLFLDDQGHELYRVVGYESPDKFVHSMSIASMGSTSQLEENLKTHPNDPQVIYALAQKYSSAGDNDRGQENYRRVISLDKDNQMQLAEQAALAIAQFENKKGNASLLESFVYDYPNAHAVREVSYELALHFLKAKDAAKAHKYFELAVEVGQETPELLNGFAWECAEHKLNLVHALQCARKAVTLAAGPAQQATYLDTQAEVYYAQGDMPNAAKCEQDAIALLVGEGRNDKLLSELQKRLLAFEPQTH